MIFHTSKFYKSVLYALTHMDMDDLVSIHNSYCKELFCEDDVIGKMSDFNDNFCGLMPLELADLISKSPMSFHTSDKYYWIDGCGKICSGNNFEELPILVDVIAEYICENNEDFSNEKIADLLKIYNNNEMVLKDRQTGEILTDRYIDEGKSAKIITILTNY